MGSFDRLHSYFTLAHSNISKALNAIQTQKEPNPGQGSLSNLHTC